MKQLTKIYSVEEVGDLLVYQDGYLHQIFMKWGDSPETDRFYAGQEWEFAAIALGFNSYKDFQEYVEEKCTDPEEKDELIVEYDRIRSEMEEALEVYRR